ncbi:UPF0743 protein [Puccinia sorghi]|uniref:UPF0743 protein n=1 Tax=Puccinia sorghi TaxID=27349 RepID=A0A0L6VUP9_9BASI|nr:UPF0743 protein [Puccinia sorghi]
MNQVWRCLDSHSMRCRASVTCLDCSTTFNGPASWKPHTTCISEAQKYQKSLYQAPKNKKPNNSNNNNNHDKIHSKTTVAALVPLDKQPTPCVAAADVVVSHGPATLLPLPAQHNHPDQASEKEKRTKKDKKRKSHDRLPAPCVALDKGTEPEILPCDTAPSDPTHVNTNEKQTRIKKKPKSNNANTGLGPGQKTDEAVPPPSENTPPHPEQAGSKETKEKRSKKKEKKRKTRDRNSGLVESETTDEPVVPPPEKMHGDDSEPAQRKEKKRSKKEKKRKAHECNSAVEGPETAAVQAVVRPSEPAPSGGDNPEPGRRKETKEKREKKRRVLVESEKGSLRKMRCHTCPASPSARDRKEGFWELPKTS